MCLCITTAVCVLEKMLLLDPEQRACASEALDLPFFSEFRDTEEETEARPYDQTVDNTDLSLDQWKRKRRGRFQIQHCIPLSFGTSQFRQSEGTDPYGCMLGNECCYSSCCLPEEVNKDRRLLAASAIKQTTPSTVNNSRHTLNIKLN